MSIQQFNHTYQEWIDNNLTDGEALDIMLERDLLDVDTNLVRYVLDTDGDELSDEEAIELIRLRIRYLLSYL